MEYKVRKEAQPQPRMIWSHQETEDLIEIMQSKFIHKIVTNRNCRKWPIFEQIQQEMERYGHEKTTQQIVFKYKNLLSMYRQAKQGGDTSKKRFEFYDKMNELFQDGSENSSTSLNINDTRTETEENYTIISDVGDGSNSIIVNDEYIVDDDDENVPSENEKKCIVDQLDAQTITQFLKEEEDDDDNEDPLGEQGSFPPKRPRTKIFEGQSQNNTDVDAGQLGNEAFKSKKSTKSSTYVKNVDYLIKSFQKAQENLQNKFFEQQLKLQQQQQEWEERMLDEEREFFSKVIKSRPRNETENN